MNGNRHEKVFEGFEATVLSHEYDHLDGILHMDIAEEVLVMSEEERRIFRQTHDYQIISKTGSYNELKKQKVLTKN
ncbi:MAG: peptide deformylase [Bacilli bacterium]|nr:peptide deformylase [Bacilli bacterium]